MRLQEKIVLADHDTLTGVSIAQHHQEVAAARFIVNSQSIPGSETYLLNVALGKSGCSLLRAIMRGPTLVSAQGHVGLYLVSAGASTSSSIGIMPYSGGVQSYMGGYSRLHGDSYLSEPGMFGPSIYLFDAYVSGSNAVFDFRNVSVSAQNLTVYGSCVAK